ncbi:MAG TPA: NAD(+)/NADH kinase [Bacteroidetes bacterium]|nr:NAD(+)/NADH kinase [Bacteroidota bacterium]
MKKNRLGIIANTGKPVVADVLPPFLAWLRNENIPFVIVRELGDLVDLSGCEAVSANEVADRADFVLSFGGDGTFLRTAHLIAPSQVPIIGVNLGAFGYLAEVGIDQLHDRINDILHGRYFIQERVMLEASIEREGGVSSFHALNDIVLDKGDFPRTVRLETSIDDEYLNSFNADGLIVSSPTGSTGYSLSVGGPIIEPEVDVMIISPINPHMLANRPLVVSGDRTIAISVFSEDGQFQIVTDGQRVLKPDSGKTVVIRRSSWLTRLIKFGDLTFYSLLRNKLHWRDQLNRAKSDR